MNFQQLAAYIRDLQRSGIDTITLQVSFYRKFALPLFALVMALISVPFAFLAGNRGAMAGVGVSLANCDRLLGDRQAVRATRGCQLVAGDDRGVVARRSVRDGRNVLLHPDADVSATTQGAQAF